MSLTIGSIRRHVFDVLKRNDIRYDVFWSTMMTTSFSNARTKEKRVKLNIDDYKLVSPCRYAVFNQDTIKENLYSEYRRHTDHDAWKDGFVCLRNVLCSYYSQTKLSELISSHAAAAGIRYDAILALRPDTAVMSDIDLPRHLQWIARNPSAKSLWIPDFHSYLGYNDRAAFGSPEYVHTYLTRGSFYLNASFGFDEKKGCSLDILIISAADSNCSIFVTTGTVCKNQGRHRNTGECFVKLYLDHFGVSVKASAMRMLRTRYNGVIPKHDHGLINMNIAGNEPAIVDYKRCVRINSSIRDKSQNTFLNSETC